MYQRTQVIGDTEQLSFNSLGTKGFRHNDANTPEIWIKDIPRPTAGFDHSNWRMTYSQAICLPYNYGRAGDDRHLVLTTRMHPADPKNDETIPVPGGDPTGNRWRYKRGWGGASIGSQWDGQIIGGGGQVGSVVGQAGGKDFVLHEERCTKINYNASGISTSANNVHSAKSAFGAVPVTGYGWKRIVVDHVCRAGQHGTRIRILAPASATVFYDSGEVFTVGSGNFVSPYDEGCWNIALADVSYTPGKTPITVGRAVVFYTDVNTAVTNP